MKVKSSKAFVINIKRKVKMNIKKIVIISVLTATFCTLVMLGAVLSMEKIGFFAFIFYVTFVAAFVSALAPSIPKAVKDYLNELESK